MDTNISIDKNAREYVREMLEFTDGSPTCYQAVESLERLFSEKGFLRLDETTRNTLAPGGKYYITRNGSTLAAFILPQGEPSGFSITAAHSDSPCLKIKPNPEMRVEDRYLKLNCEKYGGMISSTWFDRPLSVAGRITVKTENGIKAINVDLKRDIAVIPNLAIHLSDPSKTKINVQKEMLPLIGLTDNRIIDTVAECAGVKSSDILGTDLFLYNNEKGKIIGMNEELFSAARIDDLECVYATARGLIGSHEGNSIRMCCVFDNEEVGSGTKQGAKSTFLSDTISMIMRELNINEYEKRRLMRSSFMLSADNGHAVHPNYPEASCPTSRPYLGGGVLIKYNAQQKYTTDAVSEGIFKAICEHNGIPYQEYVNRSDLPGGSTLGNLSSEKVSINTVDIGAAQLAMHSAYETASVSDAYSLFRAVLAFYDTDIYAKPGGEYELKTYDK